MKKYAVNAVIVALIGCSVWMLGTYFYSYLKVDKEQNAVQTFVTEQSLKALQVDYPQVKGWIKINDTKIDYPIVQASDNQYYLSHNYKNEAARTGAIFLDFRNDATFKDRHTIIYGHALRNGSMFGNLKKFSDPTFLDENGVFTIEINGQIKKVQIFSAYETLTDFYYLDTQFTDETMAQFIQTIQQKSIVKSTLSVSVKDQIITLSTCTTSTNDNERFVVHAKVVE